MEPFYLSYDEFWDWFHKDKKAVSAEPIVRRAKTKPQQAGIADISSVTRRRYICLFGKHRPGKKTKVWEGDGYLSITDNNIGHLCDLRGRLLEEPTLMEEINLESGDEIQIGDMEVQIVDLDET